MGGRKYPPGHDKYVSPEQESAKAKADADKKAEEAKAECDDAVKWYVKELGFQSQLPRPCTLSRPLPTQKS